MAERRPTLQIVHLDPPRPDAVARPGAPADLVPPRAVVVVRDQRAA